MKTSVKLLLALPLFVSLSHAAFAVDVNPSQPVDLVGANDTAAPADTSVEPVDSTSSAAAPAHKSKHKAKAAEAAPAAAADAAPAAVAPADANYIINAGDVLQITVWKEDGLDREVLVLPDGTITFPLIGSFVAKGMTPAKVQATIKEKLSSLIPGASVAVLVKAALGHTVSVIGQVQKPGEFVMGHGLSVMQALSQAGGLTPYASESSISILRRSAEGKESAIPFDYGDIVNGHHLDSDIQLQPGDVVVVPTAGLF